MARARVLRDGSEPPCAELTAREGAYLRAVQRLAGAQAPATQVAIARAIGVSEPTVHDMIKRLRRLELLEPSGLVLTATGTSAALVLASRHRAADVLTREVLELDIEDASLEAARLAPSLSPALTRRLIASRRPR